MLPLVFLGFILIVFFVLEKLRLLVESIIKGNNQLKSSGLEEGSQTELIEKLRKLKTMKGEIEQYNSPSTYSTFLKFQRTIKKMEKEIEKCNPYGIYIISKMYA